MKPSWHHLIPSLPFLLNHLPLPSPELNPILFRLLFCTPSALFLLLLFCRTLPITALHGPHRKKTIFTALLPSNDVLLLPCVRVLRECVYRPVAQQWVYTSQYICFKGAASIYLWQGCTFNNNANVGGWNYHVLLWTVKIWCFITMEMFKPILYPTFITS
jgi:hypothetical protein